MGSPTQVYVYQKKQTLKSQFILGVAKKSLGSSFPYYQAWEYTNRFWAELKAW